MRLSDLPADIQPREIILHPDLAQSSDWPALQVVLRRWLEDGVAVAKSLSQGDMVTIAGVGPKELGMLRRLLAEEKCHLGGILVLVPCGGKNAQASDGTGAPASVSGTSGDDGSKGDQLD